MKNCEYYRELISCMLDGELDEAQRSELEEHIAECAECAAVYKAFASVSEALDENMQEPPENLLDNVMQRIGEKQSKKKSPWLKLLPVAACAAIVIFAGVKSGIIGQRNNEPKEAASNDLETAYSQSASESDDALNDEAEKLFTERVEIATPEGETKTVSGDAKLQSIMEAADMTDFVDFVPQSEPLCELSFEKDGQTVYCEVFIDGDKVYANFGSGFVLLDATPDEMRELIG